MTTDRAKNKVEIIDPPNHLKAKVGPGTGIDPKLLADAEAAVEEMAADYVNWVQDDIAKLQATLDKVEADPGSADAAYEEMFNISHDVKGQGGTFGYPLITRIGNSLCRYVEAFEDRSKIDPAICGAHINAMRAVITNKVAGDGGKLGAQLVTGLDAVVAKAKISVSDG